MVDTKSRNYSISGRFQSAGTRGCFLAHVPALHKMTLVTVIMFLYDESTFQLP